MYLSEFLRCYVICISYCVVLLTWFYGYFLHQKKKQTRLVLLCLRGGQEGPSNGS